MYTKFHYKRESRSDIDLLVLLLDNLATNCAYGNSKFVEIAHGFPYAWAYMRHVGLQPDRCFLSFVRIYKSSLVALFFRPRLFSLNRWQSLKYICVICFLTVHRYALNIK